MKVKFTKVNEDWVEIELDDLMLQFAKAIINLLNPLYIYEERPHLYSNDYEESVEVKLEGIDDHIAYDDVQQFLDIFEDTYEKYGNKLLEAKNDVK
tara:strand:- start:2577 stop:2864 length:288 start_codon:yes stop_codon:yes gene_type:complete